MVIKTEIDLLYQEMEMQKKLIQDPWSLEELKKTMLQEIMLLKEEIWKNRMNL